MLANNKPFHHICYNPNKVKHLAKAFLRKKFRITKIKIIKMKKVLALSCCIAMLVLGSCKKDTTSPAGINSVSTDYKAFIVEFTATWCPYCGTNGYPNWDPAFSNHPHKVTGLSCHPADGLVTTSYPEQSALETFYQCGGYPTTGFNATGGGYPSSTYWSCIDQPIAANAQA